MSSFQTRLFPPQDLANVPLDYITDQLHNLATNFWDKPDTADCTIIVPFPHAHGKPQLPAFSDTSSLQPTFSYTTSYDSTSLGRRVTQPPLNAVPRISLPLHIDYLSAHSSFLRGLFSGALPIDLMYSTAPPVASNSSVPADRQPRLMPCSPDHPIVFLPVPDPSSFHLLIHWMYFGDFKHIQQCLLNGSIQWEGIARNAEYLGLNAEIKIFLGTWYNVWLNPDNRLSAQPGEEDADADSDTVYSDSDEDPDDNDDDDDDDDDNVSECSTASGLEDIIETDNEKHRGRIGIRPVSFQSFQSLRSPSV